MNFIKKNINTNINNIPIELPIIIIVYSVTYILLIHTRTHTRNACARAHDLIKRRCQSLHNIFYISLTKLANKPNINKNKDKKAACARRTRRCAPRGCSPAKLSGELCKGFVLWADALADITNNCLLYLLGSQHQDWPGRAIPHQFHAGWHQPAHH